MELLTQAYIGDFLFRYLHIAVGITWIGLLYYFNLVQVPALAAYGDEGKARMLTLDKVARRALWWFRWAAIATLVTGLLITGLIKDYWQQNNAHNMTISLGMIYGTLMAANVWMIIWKNQKVVLANAVNVEKRCSLRVRTLFSLSQCCGSWLVLRTSTARLSAMQHKAMR